MKKTVLMCGTAWLLHGGGLGGGTSTPYQAIPLPHGDDEAVVTTGRCHFPRIFFFFLEKGCGLTSFLTLGYKGDLMDEPFHSERLVHNASESFICVPGRLLCLLRRGCEIRKEGKNKGKNYCRLEQSWQCKRQVQRLWKRCREKNKGHLICCV